MSRRLNALALAISLTPSALLAAPSLNFDLQWTHRDGAFDSAAAEIVAYDEVAKEVYVVNGGKSRVDVLDKNGIFQRSLDLGGFGQPNSVAVKDGVVAVAVADGVAKTNAGRVYFFDTAGTANGFVTVGALPDMVTFTPDGARVLVANEGEPDHYGSGGTDPEGSVSIIDISGGANSSATVATAGFGGFNKTDLVNDGVRITGPGASVAQDIEPEYIAVSADGTKAYVTLQENNAVAVVDLATSSVADVRPLGFKDHSLSDQGLDGSDRDGPGNDGAINVKSWPVKGMYMPDTISSYTVGGKTYLVTANEGDGREYDHPTNPSEDYADELRVGSATLSADLNAQDLKNNDNIGRLNMSRVELDGSSPTTYDEILTFGARSFSIWDADTGAQVFDSGDDFEQITAALPLVDQNGNPAFNSGHDGVGGDDGFDTRSDNKGPEPEALTLGEIDGMMVAFIGLERFSAIMVYDITNPNDPRYLTYLLNRDFTKDADTAAAGDLGPEGLYFIDKDDSWTGNYGLLVANEISGTTSYYDISVVPVPATLALFGLGLPLLRRRARAV